MATVYRTRFGEAQCGDSRRLLAELPNNSVNLVITSPPFALQRQKEYGNVEQQEYVDWLTEFARLVHQKLSPDGSFVLDLGGSYMKGLPTRSLFNFRVLIRFCDDLGFSLAQDFYWFNPAKLPSPIEWVNKRKIRVKDAVNTIWWFSKTEYPKANITKILTPYSERMKKLLADPHAYYKPTLRPSGHDIGAGFGKDNGGAIPPNLLALPNTESNGQYTQACKNVDTPVHPARFPIALPIFFIRLLTEPGDLVLDIFSGSNTTGSAAEAEGRRWLAFEKRMDYVVASAFRFLPKDMTNEEIKILYQRLLAGNLIQMDDLKKQGDLLQQKEAIAVL